MADNKSASGISRDSMARLDRYAGASRQEAARSEIIRKMPPWVERGVIYTICGAVVITLGLLIFGQVHVAVTAKGRILPEGDLIVVQALEPGVVKALVASAGDRVRAGSPLVRLDVSESGINLAELVRKQEVQRAQLEAFGRSRSALKATLANPEAATAAQHPGLTGNAVQLIANLEDARLKLENARQELARGPERRRLQQQEIDLTRENIQINQRNFGLQQKSLTEEERQLVRKAEQLKSYRALAEKKLISTFELGGQEDRYRSDANNVLNARQRLDQQAIDVSNQKLRLADLEIKAQTEERDRRRNVESAQAAYQQSLAALRQEQANLKSQTMEAETTVATTAEKIRLAERSVSLTTISAPVAGTVAELKVHNAGEMVAAGTVVATIAPEGVPLVIEAQVPNKDVGFVRPGLDARIKVDAYPYQQFGVVKAQVERVLPGSGAENFTVKLRLVEDRIRSDGRDLFLFPGLTIEADMLTGKQSLLKLLFKNEEGKKE